MTVRIITGDALEQLRLLPAESVHMAVTSPPYFGLRDYGTGSWEGGDPACAHKTETRHQSQGETSARAGRTNTEAQRNENHRHECSCGACHVDAQLGLEPTYQIYVERLVEVFREVWRVLRSDGTCWINLGDGYAGGGNGGHTQPTKNIGHHDRKTPSFHGHKDRGIAERVGQRRDPPMGLKPKDLMMMPARVAIALQDAGWYLRSEIIWAKKSPMPESVTDRPTSAHEKVFLFAKSQRYFYDAEAVKEEALPASTARMAQGYLGNDPERDAHSHRGDGYQRGPGYDLTTRNQRNVWLLGPEPYPEAHFATFVTEIPRRAILAGTSAAGVCQICGAPWERQTKTTLVPGPKAARTFVVDARDAAADPNDQGSNRQKDGHKPGWRNDTKTLGWSPSCRCPAAKPVPATVLDPFGGAGTTGLVADRLGRDAILIELSPAYAELARRRLEKDAGMFAEVAAE